MKNIFTGVVSAIALLGLAACGDADDTTTQGIDQPTAEEPTTVVPEEPATQDTDPGAGTDSQ